ncbi:hypothetical protein M0R45_014318 [Rubus argutus]|uniref:Uncharacterized protein n=1 Tax=Rubus argutus TaxID=59490 RepID=A0AAW1XLY4_RUBAR
MSATRQWVSDGGVVVMLWKETRAGLGDDDAGVDGEIGSGTDGQMRRRQLVWAVRWLGEIGILVWVFAGCPRSFEMVMVGGGNPRAEDDA